MPIELPASPFDCLPEPYIPTDDEIRLSDQYVRGDFSGGYLKSQIAHFRRPGSSDSHAKRREKLRGLIQLVSRDQLELPESFLRLVANDEYIDRIRHNTIWLNPVPALTPLPNHPDWKLVQIFYEGQGCGFWFLLLATNEPHRMVFCNESLGIEGEYPNGFMPDITKFQFYECAESFDEWLTYYLLDCIEGDKRYTQLLEQFPNM